MTRDENVKRVTSSNKIGKPLGGRSHGFTLIEVLIALALFAIIAIVFAGGLSTASRAVTIADIRTRAESLGRTQMESIKEQDYIEATASPWQVTYDRISGIPDGYSICSLNWTTNQTANCGSTASPSVIAVAWDSAGNQPATDENGLQKITLVIKHEEREILTLEGYKVYR
jgi:prepilin-type N-terminal cleavage/methylation domain-containing protein